MAEYEAKIDLGITGLGPAEHIGRGGFADVYRAEQLRLRRTVAVKVLRAQASDPDSEARFERECHAIGAVSDHPHIVGVHEGGFTRNGRAYLVMEYLPGGSLLDRIKGEGPLPASEAVGIIIKIGRALAVAHDAGVLHRDVKPANIMMSAYREPALGDFGIARIEGGHQTATGLVTASFAHAAPEVLEGHSPTTQADVYSLGSTLFELLTGKAPYYNPDDESIWPLMKRILSEPMPKPESIGMGPPLGRVYNKMTARDLVERYMEVDHAVRDLGNLVDDPNALVLNRVAVTADLRDVNSTLVSPESRPQGPTDAASRLVGSNPSTLDQAPSLTPKPDLTSLRRADTEIHPPGGGGVGGRDRGGYVQPAARATAPPTDGPYGGAYGQSPSFDHAGGYGSQPAVSPHGPSFAFGLLTLLLLAGAGFGAYWFFTSRVQPGAEAAGTQLIISDAAAGPLQAGTVYRTELLSVPIDSSFRYLIDGQPVGDYSDQLSDFAPMAGRHDVSVEIRSGDTISRSGAVRYYALDALPPSGYRANLSSVPVQDEAGARTAEEQWAFALDVFDELAGNGGHPDLYLLASNEFSDQLPGYWNLFVPGFETSEAVDAYCAEAGLEIPVECFSDRFDPTAASPAG